MEKFKVTLTVEERKAAGTVGFNQTGYHFFGPVGTT